MFGSNSRTVSGVQRAASLNLHPTKAADEVAISAILESDRRLIEQ
jgi:hypothetical protein